MDNKEKIKEVVREKYAQIAEDSYKGVPSSCCGDDVEETKTPSCCGGGDLSYTVFSDDYTQFKGYNADADLKLGCGVPTKYADIQEGNTVVDLGSGAGNDVFVARAIVGDKGKVIGLDMTGEMIAKANLNNAKLGYTNVEFKLGEIEDMPFQDKLVDVVISNCVLNLVPDKSKAFKEIYRILKQGGHFCISDIVTHGELPDGVRRSAELYAGCVAGAMQEDDYISVIEAAGFKDVKVKRRVHNSMPEGEFAEYMGKEDLEKFKTGEIGLYSITVVGYKK